jgi:hypothetical protein
VATQQDEMTDSEGGTHVSVTRMVAWWDSGLRLPLAQYIKSDAERLWLVGEVLAWLEQVGPPARTWHQVVLQALIRDGVDCLPHPLPLPCIKAACPGCTPNRLSTPPVCTRQLGGACQRCWPRPSCGLSSSTLDRGLLLCPRAHCYALRGWVTVCHAARAQKSRPALLLRIPLGTAALRTVPVARSRCISSSALHHPQ